MSGLSRRMLLLVGALAAPPTGLRAQSGGKVWRVGVLLNTIRFERLTLRQVLGEVGLEEGRNLQFEVRSAQGKPERLDALAAELVAAKVDAIVAATNTEIEAAKRATRTIPILMLFATAPVELGLVASLARPGGNVTGTTTNAPELATKMVEVLRDLLPRMKRLAYLNEPDYPGIALYERATERAAKAYDLRLTPIGVRSSADIDAAFIRLEREAPDALLVSMTGPVTESYRRIVAFTAERRLPAVYSAAFPVRDGGLIAYSADFVALSRRSAAMLAQLLKGASPAEIPIEEPSMFELVVNLKTASALGIAVPTPLLLLASEVIR